MKNIILIIFGFITLTATAGQGVIVKALATNPQCYGTNTGGIELSVQGGIAPYSYSWNKGLPGSPSQTQIGAGTYEVTVTDNVGNEATATVVLTQPAQILLNAVVTDVSGFGGSNGEISLQVSGGTPGYSYQWNTASTNQSLWDLTPGNYSVIVTDAAGCTATTSTVVRQTVMLPGYASMNYSIQTDNDPKQKAKSTVTGVEEANNDNQLVVYPIPANNVVNVKGLGAQSQVTLLNYAGQVVDTRNANTAEVQMNVSNLPAGTYVMVIKNGDVTTNKLVSVVK